MGKKYILLLLIPVLLGAQEIQPEITLEKMRLLILPSTSQEEYQDVGDKATAIVASEATKLGRFEIIDRNHLESIMDEQALQLSGIINDEEVVEIGKIAAAPEALLVTVMNFGQKGVPPEDEKEEDKKDRKKARESGLLGIIAKSVVDAAIDDATKEIERYPNNIQTTLHVEVRKIDLESGQSLDAFTINTEHTGGNNTASLNKVLGHLTWQIQTQLKELYLLSSQIVDVRGREVILLLGQNMGLRRGTLFSISTPASERVIGDKTISIPGRQIGIVEVTEISGDANRGMILRKWEHIEPGYPAMESTGGIMAGGLSLGIGTGSPDLGIGFQGFFNPLGRLGGSLFLGVGTLKDSREETDFSFRFGGDIYFRLINTIPFSLAASLSLPLNLAMRSDDDDNTVSSLMLNPVLGARAEIMIGPKMDLVATVGYCPTSHMSRWTYSEKDDDDESKSYSAVWDLNEGPEPDIDPTGLYFNVGLRFLIFNTGLSLPAISDFSKF